MCIRDRQNTNSVLKKRGQEIGSTEIKDNSGIIFFEIGNNTNISDYGLSIISEGVEIPCNITSLDIERVMPNGGHKIDCALTNTDFIVSEQESDVSISEPEPDVDRDGEFASGDPNDSDPCIPSVSNEACRSRGEVRNINHTPIPAVIGEDVSITVTGSKLPDTTQIGLEQNVGSVSYTHLTLPTICSV